jgi:hypothetical protein
MPREANVLALAAYAEAVELKRRVADFRRTKDLDEAGLATQHLGSLADMDRTAVLLDAPLTALDRFGDADAFWTRLLARLAREANWPRDAPVVSAMSADDFWTDVPFPLVLAPRGATLLDLPALVHELAHPFVETAVIWTPTAQTALDTSLVGADARARQAAAAVWGPSGFWLTELACDAVATFLMGPAYAWQHIAHMVRVGQSAFLPVYMTALCARLHPADRARIRLCADVCRLLGMDADPFTQELTDYEVGRGDTLPSIYGRSYPSAVLEAIAVSVIERLRGLIVVSATAAPVGGVAAATAEAWKMFLADPATYEAWAPAAVAKLAK